MSRIRRTVALIDALHTDEWCAGEVHRRLKEKPIEGVEPFIGNPWGWLQPVDPDTGRKPREYLGQNLNKIKRGNPGTEAERRAETLDNIAANFDIGIVVHGTEASKGEFVVYGKEATMAVRGVATSLDYQRAVIAGAKFLSGVNKNVLELEFSPDGDTTIDYLLAILPRLTQDPLPAPQPITEYVHSGSISLADGERLGLPKIMDQFQPFSPEDCEKFTTLGYERDTPFFAVGWDADLYGPRSGFVGEVAKIAYDPHNAA